MRFIIDALLLFCGDVPRNEYRARC